MNKIRLTESHLRNVIKESVKKVLNEDNSNAIMCALDSIEKSIKYFEDVQAMSYNFGMENEANEIFSSLWAFKQKITSLQK